MRYRVVRCREGCASAGGAAAIKVKLPKGLGAKEPAPSASRVLMAQVGLAPIHEAAAAGSVRGRDLVCSDVALDAFACCLF